MNTTTSPHGGEILTIRPIDQAAHADAYWQIQREHESWLGYRIIRYHEELSSALVLSLLLGILFCILGGLSYFFTLTGLGNWLVGLGLVSFGLCIGLLALSLWASQRNLNSPKFGTHLGIDEVKAVSRLPRKVRSLIGAIERQSDQNISYHFSYHAFIDPASGHATLLWTMWIKRPRLSPDCVHIWTDGPRSFNEII